MRGQFAEYEASVAAELRKADRRVANVEAAQRRVAGVAVAARGAIEQRAAVVRAAVDSREQALLQEAARREHDAATGLSCAAEEAVERRRVLTNAAARVSALLSVSGMSPTRRRSAHHSSDVGISRRAEDFVELLKLLERLDEGRPPGSADATPQPLAEFEEWADGEVAAFRLTAADAPSHPYAHAGAH